MTTKNGSSRERKRLSIENDSLVSNSDRNEVEDGVMDQGSLVDINDDRSLFEEVRYIEMQFSEILDEIEAIRDMKKKRK